MRQTVELEIEGHEEKITVTYTAVDLRRYETYSHKSVLVEPMSMTMLTYLGWSAAMRTGAINGPLKEWKTFDEQCIGVKTIAAEEDQEPRPTKRSRGGGSSAP
jgi:hypothetical protein